MESEMKNKLGCALILSIVSTLPLAVSADDSSKAYFSAGMMKMTDEGLDVLKGTGVTIDDSDRFYNFIVGYRVSPNFALEGSIISSGEISASLPDGDSGTLFGKTYSESGSGSTATIKAKTDNSYSLGLKYSGGIGRLGVNIKVGQLFWDVDYSVSSGTITYNGNGFNGSTSDRFHRVDGSDPYVGFGVFYAFSKNSSIDLDYISSEINDSDISGYSLSWVRNF